MPSDDGKVQERLWADSVIKKVIQCIQQKDRDCGLPHDRHHCAIIMAANVYEAEYVFDTCKEMAPPALKDKVVWIHSGIKEYKREAIMKTIKEEKFRIIVIVNMLL